MPSTVPPRTAVLTGIQENAPLPIRIAIAFLKAGYKYLALLGPSASCLDDVKAKILNDWPDVTILVQQMDLTSPESIGLASHQIRTELGAWDVFVHSATPVFAANSNDEQQQTAKRTTIRGSDDDMWWEPFERNVRSVHYIARHFFPKARAAPTFINVLSVDTTSVQDDKNSAENASQLAAGRVVEYLGKENGRSGMRAVNFVVTAEDLISEVGPESLDEFVVWFTSSEAVFINGCTLSARFSGRRPSQIKRELQGLPETFAADLGVLK